MCTGRRSQGQALEVYGRSSRGFSVPREDIVPVFDLSPAIHSHSTHRQGDDILEPLEALQYAAVDYLLAWRLACRMSKRCS